jgi:ribosomal protein L11 methyltransferase
LPVHIAPRWLILSPGAAAPEGALPIRLLEGAGFGDGSHPTTALCLQALGALAPRRRPFRLLDFGSGSGVLSIAAAAHLDAIVDAVEIDPRAIAHAERNFRANAVTGRVRQLTTVDEARAPFDFVVANILRSVLSSFAERLVQSLAPGGVLVLSGLVSTDVPQVSTRYAPLLGGRRPELYERGEWRALVWREIPVDPA